MTGPFRSDPDPPPKPKKKKPTMDAIGRAIRAYCQKLEDALWDTIFATIGTFVVMFITGCVGWFVLAHLLDATGVRRLPQEPVVERICQEKVEVTTPRTDCPPGSRAIPFQQGGVSLTHCQCPPAVSSAPAKAAAVHAASSAAPLAPPAAP